MVMLLQLLMMIPLTGALFAEDAGQLDFVVATAGHGTVGYVSVQEASFVTSDSDEYHSGVSCHVASRNISDGSLLWRRNVCSSDHDSGHRHGVAGLDDHVYTIDNSGLLRCWDSHGSMLWEAHAGAMDHPVVWAFRIGSSTYVATGADSVFESSTGHRAKNVPKRDALAARPAERSGEPVDAECPALKLAASVDGTRKALLAWRFDDSGNKSGPLQVSVPVSADDEVSLLATLSCGGSTALIFVSTSRGTSSCVSIAESANGELVDTLLWTTEEGLARVTSAVLLDSSHFVGGLDGESETQLLRLDSRLHSQWKRMASIMHLTEEADSRSHVFGFVKTAVLVSQSSHRVYGIDTDGAMRGETRFSIDLPRTADWHKIVHGASSSTSALHGAGGGTHSRDVLVLSLVNDGRQIRLHWISLDGTNGFVHDEGWVSLSSKIAQIAPVVGGTRTKQMAMLVLQDGSVAFAPEGAEVANAVRTQIKESLNGFFMHKIDLSQPRLDTFHISEDLRPQPVGSVSFPGERIVRVAYPFRGEMVQSPCSVLGDDSLLLKYINPHLAAVISTTESSSSESEFTDALKKSQKGAQRRKPLGASSDPSVESSISKDDESNLFVNLVDTVSGRVLYRASHANGLLHPMPSIVVSENWVFYSFQNEKTRRALLGVISLYEGMIDSKGLTAFTSPEQATTFSSLDARESKPVVLAKTYSIGKPVTALGVTSTRNGISSRRLILATVDGKLSSLDRKTLEPRRPVGKVKESEKKEGLVQYSELIHSIPYLALSYDLTVEGVTGVATAPADLESQSLVLAYGGPDIFYARTSPSKSFDLLPDSFNRPLLSIVVVGLLGVTIFLRQKALKKLRDQGWS